MYPFERFAERAKRMLTHAQQEAEGAGVNYIGTEHLLLGLFHESDGVAPHALASLGIDSLRARETVERRWGRSVQAAACRSSRRVGPRRSSIWPSRKFARWAMPPSGLSTS